MELSELERMASAALEEFREPLSVLGRRWAKSSNRPRVKPAVLRRWDEVLDEWIATSSLPLVIRDARRRGEQAVCSDGRTVLFCDNSPANWSLRLALAGQAPDIRAWNDIREHVPLTFLSKGPAGRRDLNRLGWKICHIEAVSDRKRVAIEDSPVNRLEGAFRRLLSPGNMFLVPKSISGAGELPEVVRAVAAFEEALRVDEAVP